MFRTLSLSLFVLTVAGLAPSGAKAQTFELPAPPANIVIADASPYWYQTAEGAFYWYNPAVTPWAYSWVERRWVPGVGIRRVLVGPVAYRPWVFARPFLVRPAFVGPVFVRRW